MMGGKSRSKAAAVRAAPPKKPVKAIELTEVMDIPEIKESAAEEPKLSLPSANLKAAPPNNRANRYQQSEESEDEEINRYQQSE